MRNNKTLWLVLGAIYQLLSWGVIVGYSIIKYGSFVAGSGLAVAGMVAFVFAIWMIMRSLKETSEHGYGLMRRLARSGRMAIPLFIILVIVLVLNKNIAGVVDIITLGVACNLIAMPFGILSYYASPQYTEDTSANRILERL
jgi:hypothetical protein